MEADLLWSDPSDDVSFWQSNDGRGVSFLFGPPQIDAFLKKFNFDLAYAVTAYKLQGATIKYLLIDLNQRPPGLKAMDLRSLYVILSRVAYLCRIRIMPFRPHTNKGNINNQNYLDYLKQLSQCPELAAWHRCIDPVTFLFDPSKYVKPVKGKKAPLPPPPAQQPTRKFKKKKK